MRMILAVLAISVLISNWTLLGGASATTLVPLEDRDWLSEPTIIDEPASEPQMAVSGNDVYIVWVAPQGIMFAKSADGGKDFSAPVKLADFPADRSIAPNPRISAYDNNVYIVYTTGKDVFLVRSSNSGSSFSGSVNVSKMNIEEGSAAAVLDPVISVAGNRIYVAWAAVSFDWGEIFFARSSDGGSSFGEHKNVSNNPETSGQSRIASSGSGVYLTWIDVDGDVNHISFARSTDGGANFETTTNISSNESPNHSVDPQIAAGDNAVYIVWSEHIFVDNGTRIADKIAFAMSTDSGKTIDITRYVADGSWPVLAAAGNNVYIAVIHLGPRAYNIEFVKSNDGGRTFSPQIVLSDYTWLDPNHQWPFPQIAADGANVYVAWRYTASGDEGARNYEAFLATSYDKGASFTKPLNVSRSPERYTIWAPVVVAGSIDKVHVLWVDSMRDGRDEMMLVVGQIPEEYTAPYREVIFMTPVEPYSPWPAIIPAVVVAVGAAGGVAFYLKKKKKH